MRGAGCEPAGIFWPVCVAASWTEESAGIATCDGRAAYIHKDMGLVSHVFNEENLKPLKGSHAIGHNRYSTTGSSNLRNAAPYLIETIYGPLGVAHNGNLTNALQRCAANYWARRGPVLDPPTARW